VNLGEAGLRARGRHRQGNGEGNKQKY
jgi:hypothetical protein